jgi:hypothetical protein
MIKNYNQFIRESFNGFRTIGEYIESISKNNDYALNIISQYTQDIDPTIRLANAINLLDKSTQDFIIKMIQDHKNGTEEQKEPVVSAYTDANLLEANEVIAGKNLFKCYLKVFTALGLKDTKPDWEKTPESFLIYFKTGLVDVNVVKSVMARYRQFDTFINEINYTHNECQLYFGIKCDSTFEYGIGTEDQIIPIGKFKLNKGILNWILTLDSPSAINLKRELLHLDISKIALFCKIKNEMKNFVPGSSEKKMNPQLNDDIITFGYYGIGKWDNGKMDTGELENVKNNFKIFLAKYKWAERVQVSVTSNQFWLYLNIKLK